MSNIAEFVCGRVRSSGPHDRPDPDIDSWMLSLEAAKVVPVLCLTILDGSTDSRRLVTGVRSPDTNATHPGVLSTPTCRIPWSLAHGALTPKPSTFVIDSSSFIALESPSHSNATRRGMLFASSDEPDHAGGHDCLLFLVESLLARKLGLADALEAGTLQFHAELGSGMLGRASYANFERYENIFMLNILVDFIVGGSLLPSRTAAYEVLQWTGVQRFLKAVADRDPFLLVPDGDPFELCLNGMCVTSSASLLEHRRELWT